MLRTCPPKKIFHCKDHEDYIDGHIKRCPFCTETSDEPDDSEGWQELGEALMTMIEKPQVKNPEPGQIWSISEDLEGWDDEYRYFNSTQVLIIEVNQNLQAVKASQLYSDTILMGPDDVYLGKETGFAQPWNIYSLAFEDLGFCWQTIDLALVEKVKKISRKEFQEIETNSPLYFFRQLELEVGAFFSLQSIEKLMSLIDENKTIQDIRESYPSELYPWLKDPGTLRQVLLREIPGLDFDTTSDDPLEILALMRLPDEEVSLAAASDPELISFNYVFIVKGRINVQSRWAKITHTSVVDGQGWIAGHFVEKKELQQLVVWWKKDDQVMIKADDIKFDHKYFRALFSKAETDFFDSGTIILLGLSYDLET